jgi:hypothetical protein
MSQPCTPSLRCPSSPSQPHLHHRPNVSSLQPFFSSLPPWPHSCLVGAHPIVIQAASRRAALFFCFLCAGLCTAELSLRDGLELLGHSCPCA